jgi:tetratricopeptide (TPR) repeat protein
VVEADRFISGVYAGRAVALGNGGSTDYTTINALLTKAAGYYNDPLYYRLETSVGITELSATVNEQNVAAATQQAQFQAQLSSAISAGQEAVTLAPGDYQNWLALGEVYEAIVPLGVQGAYDEAKAAYQKAEALDPTSPTIPYMLGRLEAEDKNYSAAETDIQAALSLKNDDTDAIFLLAQIQIAEGDVQSAIQSVQAGSVFTPTDAGVFFQLGFLKYYVKDYTGAAAALTTAIQIVPNYANAQYFLGLSDYALGDTESAIAQFQAIDKSNPGNTEVEAILANLESGKNPLAGISPPEPAPQNETTPPIDENSQSGASTQ